MQEFTFSPEILFVLCQITNQIHQEHTNSVVLFHLYCRCSKPKDSRSLMVRLDCEEEEEGNAMNRLLMMVSDSFCYSFNIPFAWQLACILFVGASS